MADAPSHQRGLRTAPTPANPRTGTLEQELSNRNFPSLSHHTALRNSPRPPFCSAGLRPVAPPRSLLHLPSRRFEKPLEKGRYSFLTTSHRASTNRGRAAPPRLFSPSASEFRRKHQAGTFRREIPFQAPARTFSAAILRPSPVPRRSVPRGPWRTAFRGREVAKMVVGNVVKVALWCGWRGC